VTAPDPARVGASYDAAADGYDQRHAADAAGRRRTATLDGALLAAVTGCDAVLDLGCGTGRLLAALPAARRLGVDVSAGMLAHARARGLPVLRADAHQLPLATGSVDGIVAGKGVFRYLDPARAFAECARVLRPGGTLALHQYGNRTFTLLGHPVTPQPGVWELGDVRELTVIADSAGFDVVRLRRFRSIRVWPYLAEIPGILDRRLPVQLWSHLVAVLRRR
jgi:SAM-dependent methyltransferase